jgi:hypothetical protein
MCGDCVVVGANSDGNEGEIVRLTSMKNLIRSESSSRAVVYVVTFLSGEGCFEAAGGPFYVFGQLRLRIGCS